MKTNVTQWEFEDAFLKSDTYKNNFTHSALKALYEYLIQYEEDVGEEVDFDMVALCCDYSEYASAAEAIEEYDSEFMNTLGLELETEDDVIEAKALEWLQERTQVIPFDGTMVLHDGTVLGDKGVIIQQF